MTPTKQRFKLFYRLNSQCDWQPAMPEGFTPEDARLALLVAVKRIYQLPGKGIEIVSQDEMQWVG